jgi:phosphatidylethanolamine/phosphatidyl-N-methylethanolamine N-methyltransferase
VYKPVSDQKIFSLRLNGTFAFIQEYFKHPLQIASIIPSSRFLERRIVIASGVSSSHSIVELGPGTGGTTRALLNAMPHEAKLLCIEMNPHFYELVSSIKDARLTVHLGNACSLKEIISGYNLDAPKVVISGIPFSTMTAAVGSQIIDAISSSLAPNGRFVAYQFSSKVSILCRPFLGSAQTEMELLNIPPMRIYQWEKNGN